MPNDYIIANGERLPLGDNVVAVTKQLSDIADTSGRQTSYTNRMSFDWTAEIINALGLVTSLNSADDAMYKSVPASLYAAGVPVEPQGTLRVVEVNEAINCILNGPEFEFFKRLEGLSLHDLSNISDLDHSWNITDIIASQGHDSSNGYAYPIVNYGGFTNNVNQVDARYLYPGAYLKWLLDQIAADQGYTFICPVFDEDIYPRILLQFSEGDYEHSDRFVKERSFELFVTEKKTYPGAFTSTGNNKIIARVVFGNQIYYEALQDINLEEVSVNLELSRLSTDGVNLVNFRLAIIKNTSDFIVTTTLNLGTNSLSTQNVSLLAGDTLSIGLIADVVSISQPPATVNIEVETGSFYTPEIDRVINIGDDITGESFIPDWTQKKFLLGFMNQFGLIPRVDSLEKTVEFFPFENIKENIGKAKDWSDKLVKPKNSNPGQWYVGKSANVGPYGQINYLKYEKDETLADPNYGRGEVASNNLAFRKEKDVFTLPWAATESDLQFSPLTRVARIHRWTGTYPDLEEETDAKQRLIFYNEETTSLNITDGTNSQFMGNAQKIGKFIEPSINPSLAFSSGMQAKYFSILADILNDPQKLVAEFNLSSVDVATLDHFIPVYVDKFAGYYYVNKVINFVAGKITEVELIRI